ncbi:NAD-dependent succinate-semialdehyde dehydrogenase [Vreelandella janggokensis]|uniref:NAD-dependent succinate-semialdehyde dehydrogenase n=1 Tax=Vreelandella janggokensis TaxID=370767 RepID=UPI00285877FB|nr:NAD-dependent succinate-semialdehyde dehydrogenase [Halomonas janggokensis]MDR5886105.1 NAD-dependent succinate-semialdehyde dehydrogenase [Halomonas janggokensis]
MTLQLKDPGLLKTQAYIDGQWVDGKQSTHFEVINPATGEVVAQVANAGADDARMAIEAAHRALPAWRAKTAKERSTILRRWHDLMLEHQNDLAMIMTYEQGKPLAEAKGEVAYGASYIEWFAEEAKRIYGDVIPTVANDRRLITIKQPVGVVAAITPWNFPNAMLARKAGPALAVGCTFVMKPAKETPLSALAMVELAERAGIPAGVLNLVVGENSSEIGSELTGNTTVRKVTFTGSTPVGKLLLKQCADTVKKVSMELGGNAPIIVFDDADLDQAVAGVLASKFRNAGQTCICANRILIQDGVYEAFVEKFIAAVSELKVGNGLDAGITIGPLIHEQAVKDVHAMVEEALMKGAKLMTGGAIDSHGTCFYQPTVLINVTSDMRVFREEIFGPVAPLFRFKDETEAIAMANDTEVGLASYIYTRDVGRVWRISENIEYGMVGVNEVGISSEVIPFGGIKESGLGREGSKYGLDDYLEIKYICMGGLDH